MKIQKKKIKVESKTQIEFIDITHEVQEVIDNSGIREGQVLVHSPHTTASIVINQNEPMLTQDFMRVLYRLVPVEDHYSHDLFELKKNKKSDGRSNGHSHCKNILLGNQVLIPLEKGTMELSPIQGIFFVELDGARKRDYTVQIVGE